MRKQLLTIIRSNRFENKSDRFPPRFSFLRSPCSRSSDSNTSKLGELKEEEEEGFSLPPPPIICDSHLLLLRWHAWSEGRRCKMAKGRGGEKSPMLPSNESSIFHKKTFVQPYEIELCIMTKTIVGIVFLVKLSNSIPPKSAASKQASERSAASLSGLSAPEVSLTFTPCLSSPLRP